MHATGGRGQTGEIQLGDVSRVHNGAIGISNPNGLGCDALIDDGGGHGAEMCSAAGVSNCEIVGRDDGWG